MAGTERVEQPAVATAYHLESLPTIKEDLTGSVINGTKTTSSPPVLRAATTASARSNGASVYVYKLRSSLGLRAQAPVDNEHDAQTHPTLFWPRVRLALREPFAEFLGVFVMILFGNGSVAQVLLSGTKQFSSLAPGLNGFGEYQSISFGWGIGVALGMHIAGDSGAYLNPAITFTNCVLRGLPWRRFPIYLFAQLLGGFVGSGVVYANYINAINAYAGHGVRTVPPAANATGQIFCTYPQAFMTTVSKFFSEFIDSAILMMCIYALKDRSNSGGFGWDTNLFPLGLFFLIFGLGACFGYETGYAMNMARDFGPRIMSVAVGYKDAFSASDHYFWIPIVAPFCGCLFGGIVYDILIYTGPESPINSPYMGLPYLLRPRKALRERWAERPPEIARDVDNEKGEL